MLRDQPTTAPASCPWPGRARPRRESPRRRVAACVALLCLMFAGFGSGGRVAQAQPAPAPVPGKTYHVGFSQIVDHPALNATRRGFVEGLRAAGFVEGGNLVFEYQNAQGDVGNARNIAEKFMADRVDLLAACTTPNVQATIRATRGAATPVVFGCVSNPLDAGIVKSLTAPTGANFTGLYSTLPVAEMIDLIATLRPGARTIGTVFNGGETNSTAANEVAKAAAARHGLGWMEARIASSAEVRTAAESLVGRVDVLFTPQDNTVASAFDAVVKTARDNRLPLFSLDTTAVERGAVASYGIDQYRIGVAWAQQVAVPVLLGTDPGTIVPVAYRTYELYLNTAAATASGITIPPAMLHQASKTYDK